MKVHKTIRTGKFAKAGEDYKDRDILTITNAGDQIEGDYGVGTVFKVKVPSGDELTVRFNKTSINNMIDAFGDETTDWIGKQVKAWLILQNVGGKMKKVLYIAHPDADVDDEGNFVLPAGIGNGNKGPVIDDSVFDDIGDVIE